MAKKKVTREDPYCPHRNFKGRCLQCFQEQLRANPEQPVTGTVLLGVIDCLLDQCTSLENYINDVEDRVPPLYDPQWE